MMIQWGGQLEKHSFKTQWPLRPIGRSRSVQTGKCAGSNPVVATIFCASVAQLAEQESLKLLVGVQIPLGAPTIKHGVSEYDTAKRQINVGQMYEDYCLKNNLPFEVISSIRSYDNSTLFCPAGMQKYKKQFVDSSIKNLTVCNIQSCLRLNDFDSMGDGTHFGVFNMMGTFSFRHWNVQQTIDFWMEFLTNSLGIKVDYVTIHPDVPNWNTYHKSEVRLDSECKWTDGEIGGYCTEFYVNGIEIGNIVNPLGDCIDVGFGLERLDHIVNQTTPKSKEQSLVDIIIKMIDDGYVPGYNKQGSILRRLLKTLYKSGGSIQHPLFEQEKQRQLKMSERYKKLLPKNPNQTKEWWYSTHGIDIDEHTY